MIRLMLPLLCLIPLAATRGSPPEETKKIAFTHALPNVPGKSLTAVEVSYPPAGKSPSHTHPHSAFIFAYVLEGEVRSSVDGEPARIYHVGESWFEAPGAHHGVSENASATKPAKLLAVFVLDSDEKKLVTPDPK